MDDFIFTEEAPELVATGAEALVQNADRLGLKWILRYATVYTASPLLAVYDGDVEGIGMTSLIGTLAPGTRVAAIQVPPAANFIIGFPRGKRREKISSPSSR